MVMQGLGDNPTHIYKSVRKGAMDEKNLISGCDFQLSRFLNQKEMKNALSSVRLSIALADAVSSKLQSAHALSSWSQLTRSVGQSCRQRPAGQSTSSSALTFGPLVDGS